MARGEVAGDEERALPKLRGEEAEDVESAQWRALPERRRLRVVGRADLADRRLVLAQELVSEPERGAVVVLVRRLDLAPRTDLHARGKPSTDVYRASNPWPFSPSTPDCSLNTRRSARTKS